MINEPINTIPQRTDAWFEARLGKLTASRTADALDRLKSGKPSARRIQLVDLLVTERLTRMVQPTFLTRAMEWGVEQEGFAKLAYETRNQRLVEDTGLVDHPSIPWFGASPDGLVGDDGLLEIKCPNSSTHLRWLREDVVPEEHIPQMMSQLACTGREWVDFISFDPRFPYEFQIFTRRFHRPDTMGAFEAEVREFLGEVQALEDKLRGLYEEAF